MQVVCIRLREPTTFTVPPFRNFGDFLATLRQNGSIPFDVFPAFDLGHNSGLALVDRATVIPGVFNFLYINQSVKVIFIGYLIVDFLRWIFYAAAKQAKLSGKMSKDSFRKGLSMPGLLREMRECFDRVPDLIISRGITLSDCLMAGFAMFSLKIPSMLKYDQLVRLDESIVQAKNLKSLFGVKRPPSDTWLRERLDGVDPRSLRRCFKIIFSFLQVTIQIPQYGFTHIEHKNLAEK